MSCDHVATLLSPEWKPRTAGCEECMASGGEWKHLRVCLTCGHVGCCDDSPGFHGRKHALATEHYLVTSGEDGEDWAYCFMDGTMWDSVGDIVVP